MEEAFAALSQRLLQRQLWRSLFFSKTKTWALIKIDKLCIKMMTNIDILDRMCYNN